MKTVRKPYILILLGLTLLFFGVHQSAEAQEELSGNPFIGGRLYVAWDMVLQTELPDENQALWYEEEPNDANSWRCVTCHGWDYKGRVIAETDEGALYPGIFSMVAESEEKVIAWLDGSENSDHDFSDYLSQRNMQDLSAFLISGLIDADLYIEEETGDVRGSAPSGEELYKSKCKECHGHDGSRINFGSAERPAFLGNLAKVNPWWAAHIIRFGHIQSKVRPGANFGWTLYNEIDLLTYLQHLPLAKQLINGNNAVEEEIDYSQQGKVEPMIYGGAGILLVILGGVFWGSRWGRT